MFAAAPCAGWASIPPAAARSSAAGRKVIARTDRGLEAGEVLCEATDEAVAQIQDPGRGQILREMSAEDQNEIFRLKAQERSEFDSLRPVRRAA